jgi:hypothetical protein
MCANCICDSIIKLLTTHSWEAKLLSSSAVCAFQRKRKFIVVRFVPGYYVPTLVLNGSNLVDSASSHTLVSKIKPCMSKYKSFTLKLRTAHYISYSLFDSPLLLGLTVVILELIRASILFGVVFIRWKPTASA